VFVLLAMAANAGIGRADVDLSGDWQINLSPQAVTLPVVIDQNGSALTLYFSLSTTQGTGLIDPSTGVFSFSAHDVNCFASTFDGAASPDGNSMAGTGTLWIFINPGGCVSFPTSFTGTRVSTLCGNSVLDSGEACDDGNLHAGDCCSPFCTLDAAGAPCTDSDPCTDEVCDGAGTCVVTGPVNCDDGRSCTADSCDPVLGCIHPADLRACRSARSTKLVINPAGPERKLVWKWRKGQSTSLTEFADPRTTAAYTLCIYAGTPATVVAEANIASDNDRWSAVGTQAFKFEDASGGFAGMRRIILKASDANRTKIVVKAKGAAVPAPPLGAPLTAQLTNRDTNICWCTTYDAADMSRNDDGGLKAQSTSP